MIDFSQLTFKSLVYFKVGNKARAEGIQMPNDYYPISDEAFRQIFLDYCLSPFKTDSFFRFFHEEGVENNLLYQSCATIFEDRKQHFEEACKMAQVMYDASNNAGVKNGDLFVTYFADCVLEDEVMDAIGIFKAENKQVFLYTDGEMTFTSGINIKKLDKGCIIFNTEKETGYRMLMIDKTSKKEHEMIAWENDFLNVIRIQDNSFNTETYLDMCYEFCEDTFVEEGDRKEQVLFLNKSINYFSDHEQFDIEDFATEVIVEPKKIDAFKAFKENYESTSGYMTGADFKISQPAVKTMKRRFKSLIQLDTNIDIKISTKEDPDVVEQHIEKGYDEEKKMFFYKVFFNEES